MKYILVFLADWANGLFAVYFAGLITGVEVLWWYYLVGMVLSHWLDIDAIPELLKRGKVASSAENPADHREGLHYPAFVLPATLLSVVVIGFWGWVWFLVTLLHLINDFYGTGWGIKLLWPVSKANYKLCGRRVNRLKKVLVAGDEWSGLPQDEKRFRLLVKWKKTELTEYMKQWGMEDWIETYYLRLNWVATVEYLLFLIACSLALFSLL